MVVAKTYEVCQSLLAGIRSRLLFRAPATGAPKPRAKGRERAGESRDWTELKQESDAGAGDWSDVYSI
jgi:hypothetical protein